MRERREYLLHDKMVSTAIENCQRYLVRWKGRPDSEADLTLLDYRGSPNLPSILADLLRKPILSPPPCIIIEEHV